MADLDLAGGKYTSQEIDPTETSKGLDLQTKIENLKLELLGLKSDLNGFGISEEEQEQILLQNTPTKTIHLPMPPPFRNW